MPDQGRAEGLGCNCTQNRPDLHGHHRKCRLYVAPEPVEVSPLERALRFAIADPGAFTPRGDDYTEPIPCWSARAVLLVLQGDESSREVLRRNRIDLNVSVGPDPAVPRPPSINEGDES